MISMKKTKYNHSGFKPESLAAASISVSSFFAKQNRIR
jgi:hypothetical protein